MSSAVNLAWIHTMLQEAFNNFLDRLARPETHILHRAWCSFQVCGYMGLLLAILVIMTLTTMLGLSPLVMSGIISVSILTFLGLAMITKITTSEERIICYHHQLAVVVMVSVFLNMLSQSVLPYIDITILGVGIFLVCGRIGCLMVGCCHGKPHRWGVRYTKEHAAAGFTPYYVGVRLFPIQLAESLWVFSIVTVGSVLVLRASRPGEALAWYVIAYGAGRFCFEFARGDPDRSYLWGFSEAQWTSIILMCAVGRAELAGILAFNLWHMIATAGIVFTMIAISLTRRLQGTDRHKVLNPQHVREVAEAVDVASNVITKKGDVSGRSALSAIPVARTSLNIQISASKIQSGADFIYHYALSCGNGVMSEEKAKTLSRLILQLRHPSHPRQLIKGNRGVMHLLVHPLTQRNITTSSNIARF